MNGIMKIIKLFEESGLFIKSISETIKTEAKEKKRSIYVLVHLEIYQQVKAKLEQAKAQLEQLKVQLELTRIPNAASSFNNFLNAKALWKWT